MIDVSGNSLHYTAPAAQHFVMSPRPTVCLVTAVVSDAYIKLCAVTGQTDLGKEPTTVDTYFA